VTARIRRRHRERPHRRNPGRGSATTSLHGRPPRLPSRRPVSGPAHLHELQPRNRTDRQDLRGRRLYATGSGVDGTICEPVNAHWPATTAATARPVSSTSWPASPAPSNGSPHERLGTSIAPETSQRSGTASIPAARPGSVGGGRGDESTSRNPRRSHSPGRNRGRAAAGRDLPRGPVTSVRSSPTDLGVRSRPPVRVCATAGRARRAPRGTGTASSPASGRSHTVATSPRAPRSSASAAPPVPERHPREPDGHS